MYKKFLYAIIRRLNGIGKRIGRARRDVHEIVVRFLRLTSG